MERFNLMIPEEMLDQLREKIDKAGFSSVAAYIRFLITKELEK